MQAMFFRVVGVLAFTRKSSTAFRPDCGAGPKPLRTQMRKSLMTGAAGVNEQCILTN